MSLTLFDAIERHDLAALAELLAAGADPNAVHPEHRLWTPLKGAVEASAEGGPIGAVVLLLRYGAIVDGSGLPGDATPLIVAAQYPQNEATRILLAAGANPSAQDDEGDTPLGLSLRRGDLATAELLRLCGAEADLGATPERRP
jgi:ankyrin repeat protein